MTWTFQNLISSQKYLILDLQKGQIKSVSIKKNFKVNYSIGIMFLHKFDILNRNLNGLFQKFMPVVTKLGDLTILDSTVSKSFLLRKSFKLPDFDISTVVSAIVSDPDLPST